MKDKQHRLLSAQFATEQGDERLAVKLLEDLVGEAESEPERLLNVALIARANGEFLHKMLVRRRESPTRTTR